MKCLLTNSLICFALVMLLASCGGLVSESPAVPAPPEVLGRLGLDGHQLKALVEENGRFYDMHLVEVEHAGKRYQVKQWFDITPYFKSH